MLVIDVYNVLHTTGILPPEIAGPDLDGFIRLLGHSRYRSERLMLVCDGYQPRARGAGGHWPSERGESGGEVREQPAVGSIQIFFSGHREADDVIEGLVATAHRTQAPVVVSSDRRVQAAARKRRFGVLASSTFLRHVSQDYQTLSVVSRRAAGKPSPRELVPLEADLVRLWVKALGIEEQGTAAALERREESAGSRGSNGPCNAATVSGGDEGGGAERADVGKEADDGVISELLRSAKAAAAKRRVARPGLDGPEEPGRGKKAGGAKGGSGGGTGVGTRGRGRGKGSGGAKGERGVGLEAETARTLDRELRALLEDSSDGVEESDLDMTKWLSTHPAPNLERNVEQPRRRGGARGGRRD